MCYDFISINLFEATSRRLDFLRPFIQNFKVSVRIRDYFCMRIGQCALSSDTLSKVRSFTCQVKIYFLQGKIKKIWNRLLVSNLFKLSEGKFNIPNLGHGVQFQGMLHYSENFGRPALTQQLTKYNFMHVKDSFATIVNGPSVLKLCQILNGDLLFSQHP